MRYLSSLLSAVIVVSTSNLPAMAQQIDNTKTPPDAQPGECYAKVITPPVFETTTKEVILQEASERIETIDAEYRTVDKQIVLKSSAQALEVTDTVYETETERFETRPAELSWMSSSANAVKMPASPDALEAMASSGINLDSVNAGTCFTEYVIEAQYETRTRQVKVKEASEKIIIVPAIFELVQQQVEVRAATTQVVDVPAVYRTENESVLVEPARNVWQPCGQVAQANRTPGEQMCVVRLPERYETLTKTVLETPATTKTVNVPAEFETVDVQRLVTPATERRELIPAEYQSLSRQVRVSDAEFLWLEEGEEPQADARPTGRVVCRELIPAEYTTVERQVVSEPAFTTATMAPEEYSTIPVQVLVTPAFERRVTIPARTRTVSSRVQTAPGQLDWQQVLCERDMSPTVILSVQQALSEKGFNPGPADGIMGRGTLDAIEQFQSENGLGRGVLTYESLGLLGVEPPPNTQTSDTDQESAR